MLNPVLTQLSFIRESLDQIKRETSALLSRSSDLNNIEPSELAMICGSILGRTLTTKELHRIKAKITNKGFQSYQIITELFLSREGFHNQQSNILDIHLYYIHLARMKLVIKYVPAADTILDIGGANGSLYDMGYQHKFYKMVVIDLPPEERCEMYKGIEMKARKTLNGDTDFMYGDATNLFGWGDNSIDLVWLGQVVEHMEREQAQKCTKKYGEC